jgi:hypothetical protein
MADITAYPIIFSAPMVRAILDGRKSQTRRLATTTITISSGMGYQATRHPPSIWQKRHDKFQAGERPWLWVKETFVLGPDALNYRADGGRTSIYDGDWKPSIHMPKWASRLSLRVTDMAIEHVQRITWICAAAEGVDYERGYQDPRECFGRLWDTIHGAGAWDANPEVVAISFETHKANIGSVT